MRQNNFLLVDQIKFTKFFRSTGKGLCLITCYFDFWYLDPLQRYGRSNSNIVRNLAQCWLWV